MNAHTGDWLIIESNGATRSARRGRIEQVRDAGGAPPYLVRWVDTGRVCLTFPGPDARVVTPDQLTELDAAANRRYTAVQREIHAGATARASETRQ